MGRVMRPKRGCEMEGRLQVQEALEGLESSDHGLAMDRADILFLALA